MRLIVWILIRVTRGIFFGYHSHPPFYLTAAGLTAFGVLTCSIDNLVIQHGAGIAVGACAIVIGMIMFVMMDLNNQD